LRSATPVIDALKSFAFHYPAQQIDVRWSARFACLTFACSAFVVLGIALARFTALPPIMPMTGVALAGMLLWGRRMWPCVPAAVLLARVFIDVPASLPTQLLITISLTIGPVIGVLVIERMIDPARLPAQAEHAVPIIVGAAICSLIVASCGSVPLLFGGKLGLAALGGDIFNRSIRHFAGAMLTLPLILAWADVRPERWSTGGWLHLAAILSVTAGIAYLVFFSHQPESIAWAVYPPLMWASLAFRMRGVTAAMLIISFAAFAGSALGLGIFAHTLADRVPLMLMFVAVTSATMLVFAALAHDRMSERRLRVQVSEAKFALEVAQAEALDANTRLRLSQEAAGATAWEYDVSAARLVRAFGEAESVDIMTGDRPALGSASDMTPGELDILTAEMRNAIHTTGLLDVTLRAGPVERPTRWLRFVGRYDGSNHRRRLIGMTLDVTLLHEAQTAVQMANEKLLGISRLSAMGAMASTLAHELNQPLTAVANYAATTRMLLSSGIPDANEMAREHLDQLVEASLRAGKIIRKMRDFTISGEITRTVEDLGDIVRAAWSNVRDRPVAAGAALAFDAGSGPMVAVDRLQIEQVLINLLLNAVEATVGQDVRQVSAQIVHELGAVSVRVRDNGRGLPDGMIDNLFEPFRTTKPDGTGLGLPICRTIVEAHGGRLWAQHQPDQGAEFVFTIAGDACLSEPGRHQARSGRAGSVSAR